MGVGRGSRVQPAGGAASLGDGELHGGRYAAGPRLLRQPAQRGGMAGVESDPGAWSATIR
jgi:hypothetical protein